MKTLSKIFFTKHFIKYLKSTLCLSVLFFGVLSGIYPQNQQNKQNLQNQENQQINLNSTAASYIQKIENKKAEKFSLTKEELDFVQKHNKLFVAIDPDGEPYEHYDKNLNSFYGANISILNYLMEKIGIQVVYKKTDSYISSKFLIITGSASLITGNTDLIQDYQFVDFSKPIYSVPYILISKNKHEPFKGERIGIGPFSEFFAEEIYKKYPKDEFIYEEFNSNEKALNCFREGYLDYAIVGSINLLNYPNLPNFSIFPTDIFFEQKIGVSKTISKEFIPILNKAIDSLTNEELSFLLYKGSLYEQSSQLTSNQILKVKSLNNSTVILLIILINLFLILSVIFLVYCILNHSSLSSKYDSISKLSSYNKFEKDAKRLLSKAKTYEYIILSLNVDNFSFINESSGVAKANQLLYEISKKFKQECNNEELVCLYYADNFIFLLKNPTFIWLIEDRVYKLTEINSKIKNILPEHFELTFTSSVYYIENQKENIENMINKANLAQKMKRNDFSTHRVIEYTKDIDSQNEWNRYLTLSMNKAIENKEFEVYYQPKFRFSDEKIVGAEALVRWNNPEKGFLLPGKFIPLFELNGFIEKVDKYVFDDVCNFLSKLNSICSQKDDLSQITISFNLSRHHLYNPNLIKELKEIAQKFNIKTSQIEVELTESVMFDNQKKLVKVMNDIKREGFAISVDDFGSGYSSLNLLKDLPADIIKIDKEFLLNVPANDKENIIISSVIEMAKKLKIITVAEGVETKIQSDLLKKVGCDIAQGFYYAKPMPAKEFLSLLKKTSSA